jgi:phytoene synthase
LAHCRAILADGSKSFCLAGKLLPAPVRNAAAAVYAFCRVADDEVDLYGGRLPAVARLRERLDLAYAGRPLDRPLDRALADVVAAYALPRALPEALLEGLEWDAEGRSYEDLSALHAYAARVAGSVGAMMACLMGVRDERVLSCACDLGAAMQFSNIARDVGEDAAAGHLYLPRQWLREVGIDPDEWLSAPRASAALTAVIRRLVGVAEALYARADAGIARLPLRCRPGIYAARLLYAEIGHEVLRLGQAAFSRRAVVPEWRKAALLSLATARAVAPPPPLPTESVAEARFLVEALTAPTWSVPDGAAGGIAIPWWNLEQRVVWVLLLFERLEQRKRAGYAIGYRGGVMGEGEAYAG